MFIYLDNFISEWYSESSTSLASHNEASYISSVQRGLVLSEIYSFSGTTMEAASLESATAIK